MSCPICEKSARIASDVAETLKKVMVEVVELRQITDDYEELSNKHHRLRTCTESLLKPNVSLGKILNNPDAELNEQRSLEQQEKQEKEKLAREREILLKQRDAAIAAKNSSDTAREELDRKLANEKKENSRLQEQVERQQKELKVALATVNGQKIANTKSTTKHNEEVKQHAITRKRLAVAEAKWKENQPLWENGVKIRARFRKKRLGPLEYDGECFVHAGNVAAHNGDVALDVKLVDTRHLCNDKASFKTMYWISVQEARELLETKDSSPETEKRIEEINERATLRHSEYCPRHSRGKVSFV